MSVKQTNENPVPSMSVKQANEGPVPSMSVKQANENPVPSMSVKRTNEGPVPSMTVKQTNENPGPSMSVKQTNEIPEVTPSVLLKSFNLNPYPTQIATNTKYLYYLNPSFILNQVDLSNNKTFTAFHYFLKSPSSFFTLITSIAIDNNDTLFISGLAAGDIKNNLFIYKIPTGKNAIEINNNPDINNKELIPSKFNGLENVQLVYVNEKSNKLYTLLIDSTNHYKLEVFSKDNNKYIRLKINNLPYYSGNDGISTCIVADEFGNIYILDDHSQIHYYTFNKEENSYSNSNILPTPDSLDLHGKLKYYSISLDNYDNDLYAMAINEESSEEPPLFVVFSPSHNTIEKITLPENDSFIGNFVANNSTIYMSDGSKFISYKIA
jgi:hypothetical protein